MREYVKNSKRKGKKEKEREGKKKRALNTMASRTAALLLC